MSDRPVPPLRGPALGGTPPTGLPQPAPTPVPSQLHIAVDHERCVGNGMCLTFAPGVFAHNSRRQSEVVDAQGDTVEDVIIAAENCPTAAIEVRDALTGKVYDV